jgi:hypothetical protein
MDCRIAEFTVTCAEPVTPSNTAAMLVVPWLKLIATPLELTDTTLGELELQVTFVPMSCVVPSLNAPVASKNSWIPTGIEASEGVTIIVWSVALVTSNAMF